MVIANDSQTKRIVSKGDLCNDVCLCVWTMFWAEEHGRRPKVSELPKRGQITLGKKVFEFLDYRDIYHPDLKDEHVYLGCLDDHGVERDDVDGMDVLLYGKSSPYKRIPDDLLGQMCIAN